MEDAILVVDDEPASLRALRRALEPHYAVLAARGGSEALDVLDRRRVSVVVTDQRMPGMSGVELLAACRARDPDVARIILTGYVEVDALMDAINTGEVFLCIAKPWAPRELLLAVRRAVERVDAARQRRRLARDLEAACERARREAEQRARLLVRTVHELASPAHILANAIEMLAGDPAVRESPWFGMIERGAGWLTRSLAQIRMAADVRAPETAIAPRSVDVTAALALVLDALQAAMDDRRVSLSLSAEPGVRVVGDDQWLRQLWIGLLSNAVRFTPDGGEVSVTVERRGAWAEIGVSDNGIGMTAEQVAVAFEPFSAAAGDLLLHTSGRLRFGARGLGLGMSIARGIVERHGGTIAVSSAPGRGTCVAVRLPAEAEGWGEVAPAACRMPAVHEARGKPAGVGG